MLLRKQLAELIGTFWLVFGGCGSAIFAAVHASGLDGKYNLGIGFLGVAFAFGLTVMTMAYAIGHISGCHLNPAVTIGLVVGRRFPAKEAIPYIIAQVIGACLGAGAIYMIQCGKESFMIDTSAAGEFATNGYGKFSPSGYPMMSCLAAEVILTMMFLFIILGATDKRAPAGFAPIAIGLGLTLIHLVGIPITNLSVNPARSTGPALFVGETALTQLWLFWAAPILGAVIAGILYRVVAGEQEAS